MGYKLDDSDKLSNKYTLVNNFGYTINIDKKLITERENGRLDYQIIYIDNGYGYFLIDNELKKAESGDIVLLYPQKKQYYIYNEDSLADTYWIHFTGSGIDEILHSLNLNHGIYHVGNFFTFKESIDKMAQKKEEGDFTTELFISSTLLTLLSITAKKVFSQNAPIRSHAMDAVLEKMNKEKFNARTNADYANMCEISEGHFIKTFKELTGKTPHQYKTSVAINKAINLLDTSNLNISEIADILGFEDSLYFSRIFKKEVGLPPTHFRKIHFG